MSRHPSRIELIIQTWPELSVLVPLGTFARATGTLTNLLTQVAADSTAPGSVEWYVSRLDPEQTSLEVEGRPSHGSGHNPVPAILRTTMEALSRLEHGMDIGEVLSARAAAQVQALASLIDDGAKTVVVRSADREVSITGASAKQARNLLTPRRRSFGSIAGTVYAITPHDPRPHFTLTEVLNGNSVTCHGDADILARAQEALKHRVRVAGTIYRDATGRVDTIEATELQMLRQRQQLPQVEEVRGIYTVNQRPQPDGDHTLHG